MSLRIFSEGPYYDDYDETKGFYRILFKPGVSVQARELTQLQTILQNQINNFGASIFKEGSMVVGGKTSQDFAAGFLRISSTLLNGATIADLVGQTVSGLTSTSTAKIVSYFQEAQYPNTYTLIVKKYSDKPFTIAETLVYQPDPNVAGTNEATLINQNYVFQGNASTFSIQGGVFYSKGNFVYCVPQIILMSMDIYDGLGNVLVDGTKPNARVGLEVTETITDSDLDSTLLDPSLGSYNYNAPGADRYFIDLSLISKQLLKQCVATVGVDNGTTGLTTFNIIHGGSGYPVINYGTVPVTVTDPIGTGGAGVIGSVDQYTGAITSILRTTPGFGYSSTTVRTTIAIPTEADDSFIELSRYENGVLTKNTSTPIYSEIGDTMARRTYDESGDYALNNFVVHMSDSYLGSDYFAANVGPGKAYVKGYECNIISTTEVDIPRSRDLASQISIVGYDINAYYGNYLKIDGTSVVKPFDPTTFPLLNLIATGSVTIGTARLVQVSYDSARIYRFHLSEISITNSTHSIANVVSVELNSDATTTANVQGASGSNTILFDSSISSLLFTLPNTHTKTINGNLTYSYWIVKTGTVSGGGGLTITESTGAQFAPVAFTVPEMSSKYIVYDQTDGNIVDLTSVEITASGVSPSTAVFTGLPAGITVTVLAVVSKIGVGCKSKTLNNGVGSGTYTFTYTILAADITNGYITLDNWDGIEFFSATVGSDDVTSRFTFDTGERDSEYDFARLVLKPHEIFPDIGSVIIITYDWYFHSSVGDFFCVDSYPTYDDIPIYVAKDGTNIPLENVLDFRPNADGSNPTVVPYIDADVSVGFTYYIGRADLLVISKTGIISNIPGVPSLSPKLPMSDPNSMTIGTMIISPYTKNPATDIVYTPITNRVYTMKDIGILDTRISHLEYYNALTLLEQAASSLLILDSSGNNRFQNGTLVDGFAGQSISDVGNPDLYCAIDMIDNYMTAPQVIVSLNSAAVNSTRVDTAISNDILTLDYSSVPMITQGAASSDISVNPFDISIFNGALVTKPPSDTWVDTTAPIVAANPNGANNHLTTCTTPPHATPIQNSGASPKLSISIRQMYSGAALVAQMKLPDLYDGDHDAGALEEPGKTGYVRGSTETTQPKPQCASVAMTANFHSSNYNGVVNSTIASPTQVLTPVSSSNNSTPYPTAGAASGASPTFTGSTTTVNNVTVNNTVIPFMRAININFAATGLKPDTHVYPFFNNTDIQFNVATADFLKVAVLGGAAVPTINGFAYSQYATVSQSLGGSSVATGVVIACKNNIMHVLRDPNSLSFAVNGNPLELIWNSMDPSGNPEIINSTYTLSSILQKSSRQRFQTDGSTLTWLLDYQIAAPLTYADITVVLNGTTLTHGTQWTLDGPGQNLTLIGSAPLAIDNLYVFFEWAIRTDDNGCLSGVFEVPAQTFPTGDRLLRFIDDPNNDLTKSTCHADYLFPSSGIATASVTSVPTSVVTTRPAVCNNHITVSSYFGPNPVIVNASTIVTSYYDPLAESFLIDGSLYPNGIFLESVDLCFRYKDPSLPVRIQLRPMVNGYPDSNNIIPGSVVELQSDNVNITGVIGQTAMPGVGFTIDGELVPSFSDPRTFSNFKFPNPIFLKPNAEYAIVVVSDSDSYHTFYAKIGDTQLGTTSTITKQPYAGSLFLSQNSSTWSADQTSDLMFRLNQCIFDLSGSIQLEPEGFTSNIDFIYDTFCASTNNIEFGNASTITYGIETTSSDVEIEQVAGLPDLFQTDDLGMFATSFVPFSPLQNLYFTRPQRLTSQSTILAATTGLTTYTVPYLNVDIDQIDVFTNNTNDANTTLYTTQQIIDKNLYIIRPKIGAPAGTTELVWKSAVQSPPSTGQDIRFVRRNHTIVQLGLATTDSFVSPVIDLSQFNLKFIHNEINAGSIADVNLKYPDTTVSANTTITTPVITLANGSGGALYTETTAGLLSDVTIITPGTGYLTTSATVSAPGVGGVNALVTLTVDGGGAITGVSITNPGSGYSEATVTINSTSGSGAVIYPSIAQAAPGDLHGIINGYNFFNGGSGYTDNWSATLTLPDTSTPPISVVNECEANGGNCITRYISSRVTLADGFDAEDLQVYLTAMKPVGTDVTVYYKVLSSDSGVLWSDVPWIQMVSTGNVISLNVDDYKEMQFNTVGGAAYPVGSGFTQFKMFAVKIVLTALNSSTPPRIHDLRAIALATTF